MSDSKLPIRNWYQMSPREQAVWGAAYAMHPSPAHEAAVHADRVIGSLATIETPEKEGPEYRAARLYSGLDLAEFAGWYGVEKKLASHSSLTRVTQEELETAYRIYLMCSADYY